jgi:hypothetical protein
MNLKSEILVAEKIIGKETLTVIAENFRLSPLPRK